MRRLILFLLALNLVSFTTNDKDLRSKLLEVYSLNQTEQILQNKDQKKYYIALIYKSYHLSEFDSKENKNDFEVLTSVTSKHKNGDKEKIASTRIIEMISNNTFNPLKLNLNRELDKAKSYLLKNTNQILTLYSQNRINKIAKQ